MNADPFRPELDEAAVRHPQLRVLVDAARAEPPPELHVDAQSVYVGWQQRRAGQRRGLAVGLALAAAVLLTVGLLELQSATQGGDAPVAVRGGSPEPGAAPHTERTTPAPAPEVVAPVEPAEPVLASSIHVSPLEPTDVVAEVLGPRRLRLPEGRWSIDSEEAEPVEVVLPDGALRLRGGSVHVRVAGDVAHVEALRDEVLRVDATGRWTTLRPRPSEGAAEPAEPSVGPSPGQLAREAEELMAAGDRPGAIRVLRRLVTRHGRSAAAQAGLIDLGRLLKAAGQADEARCAYGLFLARWPGHALAGDVTRAREALGDGPTCDGLRPRK
jgi:hypothetical protein